MRIHSRLLPCSLARLSSRSGQFVPITMMVLFTSVIMMIAGANIYKISKAKLQAQNLADASALAITAMEAKAINTVVDRNEWLNHMYSVDNPNDKTRLPNISTAENWESKTPEKANAYMNLVATINRAQRMFVAAYDNFLGAPAAGGAASNGAGAAALADILSEINGLQDPSVLKVTVFNNQFGMPADQGNIDLSGFNGLTTDLAAKLDPRMSPLMFHTENVSIKVKGKSSTLTALAKQPDDDDNRVGWMRPAWESPQNTLNMKVTKNGAAEPHWGAGVTIVKAVPMFVIGPQVVTATAMAYVVKDAGQESATGNLKKPAPRFRPTYYAQLAYQ